MNRRLIWLAVMVAALQGCATANRGGVPVVDAGVPVSEPSARQVYRAPVPPRPAPSQAPSVADSGVVVMVPQDGAPIQTFPVAPHSPVAPAPAPTEWQAPVQPAPMAAPSVVAPTGIPSAGALAPDEQLDGPILALLTTAEQQRGGGDLGGAASSLERAQRIAPREPQVLYRLAQVRLEQGDAPQAEQLSRRALSYASGRPALQASLWELIAQARERQGDAAGAAQARDRARVAL